MQIKGIKDEDFVNYKKPSMFIIFPFCSFKCDKENGCNLCQNSHLAQEPVIEMSINNILHRYNENEITKAIVCGGLEPFDTDNELLDFIDTAREYFYINDDIVNDKNAKQSFNSIDLSPIIEESEETEVEKDSPSFSK